MQASSQPGTTTGTQNASTPAWLERWKDYADATSSTITVIGLVIAGVWTYMRFVRKRQRFPRANVAHRIADWPVVAQRLLRLVVRVENLGEVIVRVRTIRAAVMQVLPTPPNVAEAISEGRDPVARGSSEILWDTLGDRHCDFSGDGCEVEPGETEEFIFDFVIPSEVIKVQVYTHVENITKSTKNIGWNTTTIHDVGGATNGQEWKNIVTDRAGEAETDQGASTALEETVGEINMARDETRQGSPKVVKVTKQGTLKPIKPKVESGGDRRIAKK